MMTMACANCKKKNAARAKRLTTLDLTDRVEFESPSDTYAADGSITRTYAVDYARWARLKPRGAEPDQFREVEGHTTYIVEVQYDATLAANLKDTHRIAHDDGRFFDILRIENHAPDKLLIVANDYAAVIVTDGLSYSGTDYDVILRNESVDRPYDQPGERTRRELIALVRISDFAPGITAENGTCTVNTRTYRITRVQIPARGDWYRMELADQYGALPTR